DDDIHSQRHDGHQEDDAPREGKKRVKRHKTSKSSKSVRGSLSKHSAKDSTTYVSKQQRQQKWDAWLVETIIDEDKVIPEDETPKLITELQDVDKCVPTIYNYARMKATLNDVLSNQFKNSKEKAKVFDTQVGKWKKGDKDMAPVEAPILMISKGGGKPFNTEHRLNEFKHVEPVKQKKRSLVPERNEAIRSKVEELKKDNILREVKYHTWVSNPIMVKKVDGKWKLCVDFMDINKACPKDHHPLPTADQRIESLSRYRLKCFLDAYKGYHQIQMAEGDE
nr:reverse transcriptase domain-containing protein [Tanacetum cinerariifolium]